MLRRLDTEEWQEIFWEALRRPPIVPEIDPAEGDGVAREHVVKIFRTFCREEKALYKGTFATKRSWVGVRVWRIVGKLDDGRYFYIKVWRRTNKRFLDTRDCKTVIALDPGLFLVKLSMPAWQKKKLRRMMEQEACPDPTSR